MPLSRAQSLSLQAALFYQCFALGTFIRHAFVKPLSHDFILAVLIASIITGVVMLYVAITNRAVLSKNMYLIYLVMGVIPFTIFYGFIFISLYNNQGMRKIFILGFLAVAMCIHAQRTIIHCGTLIDVDKGKVLTKMSVIVTDNIISDVVSGFTIPSKDEKLIDLSTKTVMPGLMDMHVHIEHESSPKRYEESFRENESFVALKAIPYCERTLDAGFTTVRDLGGSGVNVSLRDGIKAGYIRGPRIYTCEKSIATTGGHADPTNGVKDDLKGDPGPKEGVINGPEEAAKAVRQRYKNGANCIKITSTGGVLSVAEDGSGPQFTIPEIEAVVKAASDYGYVVAAHAHGTEGIRRAVLGGVQSIEHGTFLTADVMDLMIQKGTYLIPTITAGKFVAEKSKVPNFYPKMVAKKAAEIGPQIQATFAAAYKKGVKIAFGTDSGVSLHGENAKEFIYMVEAGMPAMEAIQSATKHGALLMSNYDKVGSIDKGKWADIIAVDGDPLKDISLMTKVSFVMKDGVVYKGK